MLARLIAKLKHIVVTFRFSILSVFISLFTIGVLSLIAFTYYNTSQNITYVSIKLMKQASAFVYHQVVDVEMRSAEKTSQSFAQLINQNILNLNNESEFLEYTYYLLDSESLPIVQIIEWGDINGNYISQEREPNGNILTNIIKRTGSSVDQTIIYRDASGKQTKIVRTTTSYDPRVRPWYKTAIKEKKFAWTPFFIFQHVSSHFLGMVAVTPVYASNGNLRGVVGVGIRIDYLATILQKISVSKNGIIYIVTKNGKLIATSNNMQKQQYLSLADIHSLNHPALIKSFEEFLSSGKQVLQIRENRQFYLANYLPLPAFIPGEWVIGVIVPDTDFIGQLKKDNLITLIVGFIILILGILIVLQLVNRIIKPLKLIVYETEKIKLFNLEESPKIYSRIKEVMNIANAITAMKKGLRSFQRYVPATLVRQLIETGEDAKIGGTKKSLAILFTDIANFTTLAEHMDPNVLMIHVCEYLDELSHIIVTNQGTIDKYIGDSIMAFWGAPLAEEFPCQQAAKAALECLNRSKELNKKWQEQGKPILYTRFGVHFGEAIVGNLGSIERLNYTAIGDSINMASRLEGMNKLYGTQIIVSEVMYNEIKEQFILRMIDRVVLKGKTKSTYLYELIAANQSQLQFDIEKYKMVFAKAFAAYQKQNWDTAIQYFAECLQIYPADTVAPVFISRSENFKINPPNHSWDGSWYLS